MRGYDVHVVDCAIRFNPFLITEQAFRRAESPDYLLSNIKIRRAFTPYQILDSACHALENASKKEENNSVNQESVYFFLAPCKQFFDGDVSLDEAVFLLEKLVNLFSSMIKAGIPLVIIEKDHYSNNAFKSVYSKMEKSVHECWRLEKNTLFNFGKKEVHYHLSTISES